MTINRTIAFAVLAGLAVAPHVANADDDAPKVTDSRERS